MIAHLRLGFEQSTAASEWPARIGFMRHKYVHRNRETMTHDCTERSSSWDQLIKALTTFRGSRCKPPESVSHTITLTRNLILSSHLLQSFPCGFFFREFRSTLNICLHLESCSGSHISVARLPITVAWNDFARSNTRIVISNPTQCVNVCLRLFYVCIVLCR